MLNSELYDILIFTESWLNSSITDSMLYNKNYVMYRLDRTTKRGGGILAYFKLNLCSYYMSEFTTDTIELICINLFSFRFVIVYRPPNEDSFHLSNLCNVITCICDSTDTTVIIGDLNFPHINWNHYTSVHITMDNIFINCIILNSFYPHVDFNTR